MATSEPDPVGAGVWKVLAKDAPFHHIPRRAFEKAICGTATNGRQCCGQRGLTHGIPGQLRRLAMRACFTRLQHATRLGIAYASPQHVQCLAVQLRAFGGEPVATCAALLSAELQVASNHRATPR